MMPRQSALLRGLNTSGFRSDLNCATPLRFMAGDNVYNDAYTSYTSISLVLDMKILWQTLVYQENFY